MRCSRCGSDNREGRKFCANCGAPLVVTCPKCSATNQPDERFCGECGTALGDAAPTAAAGAASVTASAGGERRHLTVLFCDLVNSTSLATQIDPEEWREIVADYHRAATQAIERFGGHVAQYLGDGVMAYFGYPEAHDNDAERAARAGLTMLDAISKLNQPSTRPELSARIGIDSGTVVVGASAGKDADVFGDTPNIAARVQAAAQPGTVVITEATHRLVSGMFVVEDRGAQALKGVERLVQLYRVIQPSGVRRRLEAAAATRGLTPFVGREDELRLLTNRWERALDGEGQVALIIGEAGIGKSRLLQRFHEQLAGTPHTWVEAGSGAFFQNTPFYPVTELLRQFLGGNGGKPAEEQLAQLEPRLELAGLKPSETIPLIAPLLNLPLSGKYPPLPLSPEQQRRRLLATLVEWVLGAARVQPLVVATEDLHWADASTLELIQLLVEQGATARLLLLYTARPEFRVQWPLRAHHTQITISRLSACNVRAMVKEVAARRAKHVVKVGKTPVLGATEARQLLDSINTKTVVGLRDRALIALLTFTFARIGAALHMNVEDVYWQHRRLWVRLHEKGSKQHCMPCHHHLENYLQDYIEHAGLAGQDEKPLFRTAVRRTKVLTGRRMTQSDAWRMVQRRARDAGILTDVCNHTFRATGITAYLDNGGSLENAQAMAAHESPRTTKLYDRTDDQITLDEVEKIGI